MATIDAVVLVAAAPEMKYLHRPAGRGYTVVAWWCDSLHATFSAIFGSRPR